MYACADDVLVQTRSGKVRGYRELVHGRPLDIFLGVPFADPPVGRKRFQRPEEVTPWEGVLDATQKPNSCSQYVDNMFGRFDGVDMWNANTNQSEDCLYLNIWAPPGFDKRRSVMFWIYGGSFVYGSSTLDIYDGKTLAVMNDVVVVSVNYRMGPLGFLYLDRFDAPGNVGLLDQQMALTWLYNNVDNFGGDRHSVTIFGESAGSVSTSFHLISPLSQQLFKYAILQSGSALSRWAVSTREEARARSRRLAHEVGCKGSTDRDLLLCLYDKPAQLLVDKQWNLELTLFGLTLSPIVDNYFLREHPRETVSKKNYKQTSILAGSVLDEGSYFVVYGIEELFKLKYNVSLPRERFLDGVRQITQEKDKHILESILFEYKHSYPVGGPTVMPRDILDDLLGDLEFVCPTNDFAHSYSENGNKVYMYNFRQRSSINSWPKWMGVMHGYEIEYVFGDPMEPSKGYENHEKQFSLNVMKYWTNFAKYG